MTIARRIADLFVAPAGERAAQRGDEPRVHAASETAAAAHATPAARRPPPAVAVLGSPADAPALAAALGLALARAHRSPVAVLCVWSPQPARGWRAPAMPAA
ncbi:MAG: hypothetical protein Q8K79_03510, partial [Solirubrobacteraceae bacterium]|nr:hypothetical protein [Solirubrobacteraceae bacterium]